MCHILDIDLVCLKTSDSGLLIVTSSPKDFRGQERTQISGPLRAAA